MIHAIEQERYMQKLKSKFCAYTKSSPWLKLTIWEELEKIRNKVSKLKFSKDKGYVFWALLATKCLSFHIDY